METPKTDVKPKAQTKSSEKQKIKRKHTQNEWEILSHPLMTEKSIGLVERENKLVFIVIRNSNKTEIKNAIEKAFDVKVEKVTTSITRKGQKKAFIKLTKDYSASDIATRLGML